MHTARNAVREAGVRYKRHQPELTLLYQIIETYYPEFLDYMESQGKALPTHIFVSALFTCKGALIFPETSFSSSDGLDISGFKLKKGCDTDGCP